MTRYRLAVGLEYDSLSSDAPLLAVSGESGMADEIVKLARRYNVPVVERPALARALAELEIDQTIPVELYEAVAVLLAELDSRLV